MKKGSMTEGKVTVDTAIVGQFAGDGALAAVSSCTFLTRMMIGLVEISATGLRASSAH